jgi:hypothetical protein
MIAEPCHKEDKTPEGIEPLKAKKESTKDRQVATPICGPMWPRAYGQVCEARRGGTDDELEASLLETGGQGYSRENNHG